LKTFRKFIGRIKLQLRGKNHIVGWNMTSEAVIAFYGYSGMGYEDEKAMLEIARKVLSGYS